MTLDQEIAEVLALLDACPTIDLKTAERTDDEYLECPLCGGEGAVHGQYYENVNHMPVSIFVAAGIGDDMVNSDKAIAAIPRYAALIRKLVAERKKLTAQLFDAINGTPCEQIRLQQEYERGQLDERKARQWQDISTMPEAAGLEDKRRFLVLTDDKKVYEVTLHINGWCYATSGGFSSPYRKNFTESQFGDNKIKVTHWMPLPEPPHDH